jgi:hypothetical protein
MQPAPSFTMIRLPGGACRFSIPASSTVSGRFVLQSWQILRTRRCAIAPISVDEMRNGWMPRSMRRVTEVEASFVWSVEKTRWPVSAACTAFCAVSSSRISPTMMMSGSWRRIVRSAEANVIPIFVCTAVWLKSSCTISIGSSIVVMLISGEASDLSAE